MRRKIGWRLSTIMTSGLLFAALAVAVPMTQLQPAAAGACGPDDAAASATSSPTSTSRGASDHGTTASARGSTALQPNNPTVGTNPGTGQTVTIYAGPSTLTFYWTNEPPIAYEAVEL